MTLAGDVTNDGHVDLWIGSSDAGVSFSTSDSSRAGAVYLVPGPFDSDINLADIEFTIGLLVGRKRDVT